MRTEAVRRGFGEKELLGHSSIQSVGIWGARRQGEWFREVYDRTDHREKPESEISHHLLSAYCMPYAASGTFHLLFHFILPTRVLVSISILQMGKLRCLYESSLVIKKSLPMVKLWSNLMATVME